MTDRQYIERAAQLLADPNTTVKFAAEYLSLVSKKHYEAIRMRLWQLLELRRKNYRHWQEEISV